jgi:hypothetical protein
MALPGKRGANRRSGGTRLADKEMSASGGTGGRKAADHIYTPMGERQGGGGGGMSKHRSHGSPASTGATRGPAPSRGPEN